MESNFYGKQKSISVSNESLGLWSIKLQTNRRFCWVGKFTNNKIRIIICWNFLRQEGSWKSINFDKKVMNLYECLAMWFIFFSFLVFFNVGNISNWHYIVYFYFQIFLRKIIITSRISKKHRLSYQKNNQAIMWNYKSSK